MTTKQKNITWALIDLGNVLIEADPNFAYDRLINNFKLPAQKVKKFLYHTTEHDQFCRGLITSAEYYHALLKYLQPNARQEQLVSMAAIKQALNCAILDHNPDILALMQKLKHNGIKIAIVTDTHEWQSEFFRNRINFDSYADRVFESYKVGKLKADPGYFEDICKELNSAAANIMLIDDNPTNNKNASALGIFAPGYSNYQQLLPAIAGLTVFYAQ